MSDAKSELQLIGTHGEPEPSGLFRLSYGTEPNDPVPFILTLTPQYVARAIGKTAPTDIRNYAEQNADKLKKRRLKKPEASPRTHLNSALAVSPTRPQASPAISPSCRSYYGNLKHTRV